MGFKTTNYEIKSLGITLPTAIAVVRDINVSGTYGTAKFGVFQNRADALGNRSPFETVMVSFTVTEANRSNVYKAAYDAAKEIRTNTYEGHTYVNEGPFAKWEDDIVE